MTEDELTETSTDPVHASELKTQIDPRTLLANWANKQDEWVRSIVRLILVSGRQLAPADIAAVYQLFLEEKGFEERSAPPEDQITADAGPSDTEATLMLEKISNVMGVNAIVPGSTIELNAGLTILFGENGTGKTGYARILKLISDCRTADSILPNVNQPESTATPSATVDYRLGDESLSLNWAGERGQAPFTRMAVFDSPAVNFHVDEDLAYVYTPASLALFRHVTKGIQDVKALIDAEIADLKGSSGTLLARFNRGSTIYPMIETLGAASDLDALKKLAYVADDGAQKLKDLQLGVAALQADTAGQNIKIQQRRERVLAECKTYIGTVETFAIATYDTEIGHLATLRADYKVFRESLFEAAALPAEPDETWEGFVRAGETYRQHLDEMGSHDQERCLYCRQTLDRGAKELIEKYSDYLEDKIAADIKTSEQKLKDAVTAVLDAKLSDARSYLEELEESPDDPPDILAMRSLLTMADALLAKVDAGGVVGEKSVDPLGPAKKTIEAEVTVTTELLVTLRRQSANRNDEIAKQEKALLEFEAQLEIGKSWSEISSRVENARKSDKLTTLVGKCSTLLRAITELSKTASDQLINQNFEQLFAEECKALRAPGLKLEFVGRQGKAQRRKVMAGNYPPSKILSEGEQKVVAISDFLAEARLIGITAPIVFDDPVSSLDHRHIDEVASRVALLAQTDQVVVFTHDIFFATNLLARFEGTTRCTYFQVTDDDGKGKITHATGPRWDTLAKLKDHVNESITAAKAAEGETRAALVRTGYGWIRSWCEVFVERELLQEVTQRYQPNVRMGALSKIKPSALPAAITLVTEIFDRACRYIDGHSQPLATQGVAPTLPGLEADWKSLLDCLATYRAADN